MFDKLNKKHIFYILIAIEVLILIFSIYTKQIMSGMMMSFLRIMLLLAAYCCESVSWGALYSVFALLSAMYSFNPVGLFLTGRK